MTAPESDSHSRTIPGLFSATLAAGPNMAFLQYRSGQIVEQISYQDADRRIEACSRRMLDQGFAHGDRVAILSENSCEWVIAYLAILRIGCVAVPLDSLLPLNDVLNILEHSESRMLFCSDKFLALISDLPQENRPRIPLARLGSYSEVVASGAQQLHPHPVRGLDLAVIIYTSGTTGYAKGVALSHENLVSNVLACREVCEITREDNFLVLLPLHHTFAATVTMLLPMACGSRATLATSYRSRDLIDDVQISSVSVLVGVPQIFENMMNGMLRALESAGFLKRGLFYSLRAVSRAAMPFGLKLGSPLFRSLRKKTGLDTIRLMVAGGAALPVKVNRFFESIGFLLVQGYGLTESSPVLCVNPLQRNKLGSVGPALNGVTLRIREPNREGIGEVCAKGPNIMQVYYNNPDATHRAIQDGWLCTGDAGYLDEDGYLHLTGRLKNVIVTPAGKNVYPEEIEAKLAADPAIAEALVLGVDRKDGKGERLCALLKLDDEYLKVYVEHKSAEQIAAAAIRQYNHSSPSYQNIREWRVLDGEFEKTSTRKIKRFLYLDFFK
ncbi:MAG: long-chain fatty acid--CoA ligase [bacterium]|nr:long-chain fatty acid--CoA ligase [bacterium]